MKHPEKWRETCDPFALPYTKFRPVEILGYPHAGNDVFHARGMCEGRAVTAYIKAARQAGAALQNEAELLQRLDFPHLPKLLDCGFGKTPFSVTEELPGQRLSVLLGENEGLESLHYMEEYGETLAKFHRLRPEAAPVADRKFFHMPPAEMLERAGLSFLADYFAAPPGERTLCFCHGDFHYANVLWENGHISAVLDLELAGYGDRDFDIAWALLRRPGQKFMKTREELQLFLRGYSACGAYNAAAVVYYMAQAYVYFLQFSQNDREYCEYVGTWLQKAAAGENMLF